MLLPLAGNHYESSVFFVIGTGNKGNELIAVLGSHPCVVQTFFFIIPDGIVIVPCTVLHAFSDQSVKTTFVKCNLTKKWGGKIKKRNQIR